MSIENLSVQTLQLQEKSKDIFSNWISRWNLQSLYRFGEKGRVIALRYPTITGYLGNTFRQTGLRFTSQNSKNYQGFRIGETLILKRYKMLSKESIGDTNSSLKITIKDLLNSNQRRSTSPSLSSRLDTGSTEIKSESVTTTTSFSRAERLKAKSRL